MKKVFKASLIAVLMVLVCGVGFAQTDSTGVSSLPGAGVTFMNNAYIIISLLLGIYEVIARWVPTVKDISIVGNIFKVLTFISNILNAKQGGGTHA